VFRKLFGVLKKNSGHWWYLPLVCFLAFIDLFIVVLPTEGMIVTTSIMRPRKWLVTAVSVTIASALGALALNIFTHAYGEPFIAWVAGKDFLHAPMWIKMQKWIGNYGFWGLWLVALGPVPVQFAVLICALAYMPPLEIFGAVLFGRAPKYIFFSWLATKGEEWLQSEITRRGGEAKLGWLHRFLSKLMHDPCEDRP
jgi:membrane protein YqaA with SNARE-associated domain